MSQKHVNYSKISTADSVNEEAVAETLDEEIVETLEAEPEADTTLQEHVYHDGIVTGCAKINVRATPELNANKDNVICEIEKGTKLKVDDTDSTDEWFKVYLENGIEGFCMKKFIDSRV